MAQVQQQQQQEADPAKFNFLTHVSSLPVVQDTINNVHRLPMAHHATNLVQNVSKTALSYAGPIEPYLERADQFADNSLKTLEDRYPLVRAPTKEIRDKTSGAAKTTVDTYVGAVTDKWQGVTHKVGTNGKQAAGEAGEQVESTTQAAGAKLDALVRPVLDLVEDLLDTYLPKQKRQQAQGAAQETQEAAEETVEQVTDQARGTVSRVVDLSTSLLDRSLNKAKATAAYAADSAHTAADYAVWGISHPRELPSAAIDQAGQNVKTLRARVDETLQTTRQRAGQLAELLAQAKEETLRVASQEAKRAPDDFPRRPVVIALNTSLILVNEALTHAKQVIKEQADAARSGSETVDRAARKAGEATDKTKELASEAGDKASAAAGKAEGKAQEAGEQTHEHVVKPAKKHGGKAKDQAKEHLNQ